MERRWGSGWNIHTVSGLKVNRSPSTPGLLSSVNSSLINHWCVSLLGQRLTSLSAIWVQNVLLSSQGAGFPPHNPSHLQTVLCKSLKFNQNQIEILQSNLTIGKNMGRFYKGIGLYSVRLVWTLNFLQGKTSFRGSLRQRKWPQHNFYYWSGYIISELEETKKQRKPQKQLMGGI